MSTKEEKAFRLALNAARCSKCGGRILEIQRPKVVCQKCGARYLLAVRGSHPLLLRYKLIEDEEQQVREVKEIKETITKEVVLIPCKYCGGLMPQTANFCPNCGARRKG
jgi:DNA-directed RNA polymerase subunit RPC12/RpoP